MAMDKDNIKEIAIGVLVALIILELGKFAISKLAEKAGYDNDQYHDENEQIGG